LVAEVGWIIARNEREAAMVTIQQDQQS
jgi:hypothetical protein